MRESLIKILALLNQISVRGEDTDRMCQARQILIGMLTQIKPTEKEAAPCPTSQPRTDTKSI